MKFNRFTQKGLEKEFPFMVEIFNGQDRQRDCSKCGKDLYHINSPCPCGSGEVFMAEVRPCEPEEVLIKRIDQDFLNSIPNYYSWDGSVVDICRGEEIIFIHADGRVVRDAVEQDRTSGSNYAHSGTYTNDGESILHAIDRHVIAETLAFIVVREFGIHTIEHYSSGQRLTVRKPGRGFTIKNLIRAAYEAAAEQVAAESDL